MRAVAVMPAAAACLNSGQGSERKPQSSLEFVRDRSHQTLVFGLLTVKIEPPQGQAHSKAQEVDAGRSDLGMGGCSYAPRREHSLVSTRRPAVTGPVRERGSEKEADVQERGSERAV